MMEHLPITEELDFEYLLELMPALHEQPDFAWLPELFSIVGPERLIVLCRYAGGESIRIPTLDQLSEDIEALQFFYDIRIKKSKTKSDLSPELVNKFNTICEVYDKDA